MAMPLSFGFRPPRIRGFHLYGSFSTPPQFGGRAERKPKKELSKTYLFRIDSEKRFKFRRPSSSKMEGVPFLWVF